MTNLISRREILLGGLKTAAVIAATREGLTKQVLASSAELAGDDDRFKNAFKQLDKFVTRHVQEVGAPGLTLAVTDRDRVLRLSQYGFADLKTRRKVAAETLFEIGSISKSFVAIAALQAAEDGKLDLNKPVIDYLRWLKIESRFPPFNAQHLLSHTAGLTGVPLLMRVAASTLKVGTEPGTRFLYSNIGYVLLGFLLETIDKQPLADIIRKRVLDPTGMDSSEPMITNSARARMAIGYAPLHEDRPFPLRGELAEAPWIEVPEAAGSIASTPSDMAAYMRMLLNRGMGAKRRVLSEKSFDSLIRPQIKAPFRGEEASYALGLWVSNTNNHQLLRHTGGMVAFSSAMYVDMTAGVGAFASVNARLAGYRPVAVTKYALDLVNAAAAGQSLPEIPPPLPSPLVIKNAADYAGTFTSASGNQLVLSANADQLVLNHKGQRIVLEQAGSDRFIVKHPDFDLFLLTFGRQKGAVTEVFHGSNWWTNERYIGSKSFDYPKELDTYVGRYRSDNAWYGSTRVLIRKGRLTLEGDVPLVELSPGVFRFEGDPNSVDQIVFDTIVDGKATRANYSGIEFFRTYTP